MFYAHFVLAKKGPLARIWLAAHWDKKLTKAHVFETNIEKSVDGILQPKVKMALRTSGHLLLGVVRIYSRKAKYLLADCNEAFVKIKMAFRPGMVDLPDDIREAAASAITLPEVFHDFDTPMPELNDVDIQAQFTLNQSRAEEITMREDYGSISLATADDGFGDIGFEEQSNLMRENVSIDQSLDQAHSLFNEDINKDKDINVKDQDSRLVNSRLKDSALDMHTPIQDDGFGGNLGQDLMGADLFGNGIFDENTMGDPPALDGVPANQIKDDDSDDEGNDIFGGPASVGAPSSDGGSRPSSPMADLPPKMEGADELPERNDAFGIPETNAAIDQTTLLHNEEESFALAPVDSSAIKSGWPRTKRKRKLIVDEVKNISGEEMKSQLSDTTDVVTTLDLAPPSKRLMHWKETGGVEKLFALPGRSINAQSLGRMYQRNLISQHSNNEDFGMAGDKEMDNLRLEQLQLREDDEQIVTPRPRGRPPKRKIQEVDPKAGEEKSKRSSASRPAPVSFDEIRSPGPLDMSEPMQIDEASFNTPPAPIHDSTHLSTAQAVNASATPLHMDLSHEDADNEGFGSPRGADLELGDPAMSHDDLMSPEHHSDMHSVFSPARQEVPSQEPHFLAPLPAAQPAQEYEDDVHHDEQAEDETYEQFEERVVNKRAGQLFHSLKKDLRQTNITFASLVRNGSRKQVAQKFYTLLVLKKSQAVELSQEGAYSQITISQGGLFENAAL